MSSRTKVIVAVAALLVIGGIAAFVAFGLGEPQVEVEAATVELEDLAISITAAGRVESGIRADVFPPTAGTLADVMVEDGDRVKAGTVLASMDTAPLKIQVKQAEAALAAAESQLAAVDKQAPTSAELEAACAGTNAAWASYQAALDSAAAAPQQSPSDADLAAATAATNAAWNSYSAAKSAYDALKASIETSMAPTPEAIAELKNLEVAKDQAYAGYLQAKAAQDQLESFDGTAAQSQADAAADQAYAAYLNARAQQKRLESTNLSAERRAAQTSVDQAREALATAEQTLRDADLTAPIDGVVLFNSLGTPAADGQAPQPSDGVAVAPQTPPFTVVQMNGLSFLAEVDEVDIESIDVGMSGQISLDAFADRTFESEVAQIMPAATLTTTGGTAFPVYLGLSDADADILIGMKGDVQIEVSTVPGALTVPVEALFDEGGQAYLYVIEGDTLARTAVEIGTITETRVEVVSGVTEGDRVALSGPDELIDGMMVRIGGE